MSIESKKNKTKGIIGLVVVLICAAVLIAASNPIYEALSEVVFLSPETTENGETPTETATVINYGNYTPGTYEATAFGFESDVAVTVEVSETEIVSLKVNASGESSIGIKAAAQIKEAVLEAQNAEVDAVSGATYTCDAVIEAIKTALIEASAK